MLALREYVAKPAGAPFVLAHLNGLVEQMKEPVEGQTTDNYKPMIRRWWRLLELMASYAWGAETLMQCDIAAFLSNEQ